MERFPKKKESKETLWNKEKEIVDRLTDALGLGIDEGIKDTVIALRLLDINTRSSHEGKLDRYPIPYVDVVSKQGERLLSEYNKKVEELRSPEQKKLMQEIDHLYAI